MKTISQYIEKYDLNNSRNIPYNAFVKDLEMEFVENLEDMGGFKDEKVFNFCKNKMRSRFLEVSSYLETPIPEVIWKRFYKETVVKYRDKYYGKRPK